MPLNESRVTEYIKRFTSSMARRFGDTLKKLMKSDKVANILRTAGNCELVLNTKFKQWLAQSTSIAVDIFSRISV